MQQKSLELSRSRSSESLASYLDGLSESVRPATPLILLKFRQDSFGTTAIKRADTSDILYTVKWGIASSSAPTASFFHGPIYKDSTGAVMHAQPAWATMNTFNVAIPNPDTGRMLTIPTSTFLYSRGFVLPNTFNLDGVEYKLKSDILLNSYIYLHHADASEGSAPLMTFIPSAGVQNRGKMIVSPSCIYEGESSMAPRDALIVNGRPSEFFDHALLGEYLYRRNRRRLAITLHATGASPVLFGYRIYKSSAKLVRGKRRNDLVTEK
ncbi:MAG: hypothetical protein CYPHOPRED_006032, partial [Cyphobasidiales sp. Tagirdzhanova-0007]